METTLRININSGDVYDIRVGDLVWSRGSELGQQKKSLIQLVNASNSGLILDCSFVEVSNSELINLLMSVRNYAKKSNKCIVLINVPKSLSELIHLCKLNTVLHAAANAAEAKVLVSGMAAGKGTRRLWIESHVILSSFIAVGFCIAVALLLYLLFG